MKAIAQQKCNAGSSLHDLKLVSLSTAPGLAGQQGGLSPLLAHRALSFGQQEATAAATGFCAIKELVIMFLDQGTAKQSFSVSLRLPRFLLPPLCWVLVSFGKKGWRRQN